MSNELHLGFLNIRDCAKFFDVSDKTIRCWIYSGKMKSIKVGRRVLVATSEIKRVIAEGSKAAEKKLVGKGECTLQK